MTDAKRPDPFSRREFLSSGLMLASAAASIPAFLNRSALAMHAQAAGLSSVPGVPDDHVLVVVQLGGGNDGLNTVVPFADPIYHRVRPSIGIKENEALKLSGVDGIGLHPQMGPMKDLFDDGLLGIVQGVGYPNPNRSHFKSMDIWHTADTSATGDGWLGRYFDAECCGYGKGESGTAPSNPSPPGIAIGRAAPLSMQGRAIKPVSFESAELFKWSAAEMHQSLRSGYEDLNRRGADARAKGDRNSDFLLRTALDAQVSSDAIRKAVGQRPLVSYPTSDLARQLSMVALMIRAGLRTRVFYVTHGSFDTHSGQGGAQGRHGQLLNQFAAAMKAFYADLRQQRNDDRVMTMAFSEFGRRVGQNASGGTDHGTAAPVFLAGPMVRKGVIGDHPSLKDLDDGDLKYRIDFRSLYAGILGGWLKADASKILEGSFDALPVLGKAARDVGR
ncbi:MAG: hypothetical protein RL689_2070 [Planctomycetota bacterium]